MHDEKRTPTEAFRQILEHLAGRSLDASVRERVTFPPEGEIAVYLEIWIKYEQGGAYLPSWVPGRAAVQAASLMVWTAIERGLLETEAETEARASLESPLASPEARSPSGPAAPVVGMPATIHVGSDRYAGVVSWVAANHRSVQVKMKRALRSDSVLMARCGRKGWRVTSGSMKDSKIVLGHAEAFMDPSF